MSHVWANALVAVAAAGALYAGARLLREALRRPVLLAEDVALAAAWAFVLGGLVWLRAYLTGSTLLGFEDPWTWLTASHFGAAGFGALTVTALATRMVSERARRVFYALLVAHPVAFACTAAGIAGVRVLERIGAPLYLAIFLAQAIAWTLAARPAGPRGVRVALGLALWLPVATMVPALAWAWGVQVWDLGEMIRYHGVANAAGHVGLGLGALALLRVPRRAPPLDAPLSRLRSHGRLEPGFLDAHRTIRRSVHGLTDDLAAFGRPDFDVGALHPDVVDFYERTAGFELDATGHWHGPFRLAGRVWARVVSPALGQLGLPAPGRTLDGSELESRIFEIDDAIDGRRGVRVWVRVWRRSRRTLYVAAYAEHVRDGVRYTNIAFPVPWGNLTSILHLSPAGERGLELTSRHRKNFAGDQGVYLVVAGRPWRLPIDETITVLPAGSEDELVASHEMWLFGLRYLTISYCIRRGR